MNAVVVLSLCRHCDIKSSKSAEKMPPGRAGAGSITTLKTRHIPVNITEKKTLFLSSVGR